ncbi:MAG: hypothetical protein QFX35_05565 [Candidatus Verstraetearchaeota archaeon]|nr:hypothetical protein [Candidatus Verstraetearchaeota archaeon]
MPIGVRHSASAAGNQPQSTWRTLLIYGERNEARRLALRACLEYARMGGRSLYLQQRTIAIDDSVLRSTEDSVDLVLGVFESLDEVPILISEIRPSLAVIDPVNGGAGGWETRRRIASELFKAIEVAERRKVRLILLCEMTDWGGVSKPRLYATISRFCDRELEVRLEEPQYQGRR